MTNYSVFRVEQTIFLKKNSKVPYYGTEQAHFCINSLFSDIFSAQGDGKEGSYTLGCS